jgi:serine phosphatase RsbU (regulator of sigma subunit)
MSIKKYIVIVFCFFISLNSYCNNKIDSLYQIIEQSNISDSVLLDCYRELSSLINASNASLVIEVNLVRESLLKKSLGNNKLNSSSLLNKRVELSSTFSLLANNYNDIGDVTKALYYFEENRKILNVLKDKKGIAYNLINSGYTYWVNGFVYESKKNIKTALAIGEEIQDSKIIIHTIGALGSFFTQEGQLDSAVFYYKMNLSKALVSEDINDISFAYGNLGYIAQLKNNDSLTLYYLERALAGFKEVDNKEQLAMTLRDLSRLSLKKENIVAAEEEAKKSYDLAVEIGHPMSIKFSAELLSEIYEVQNNGAKALEFYKLFRLMKDSLNNESNIKNIAQQQAKYEYEKRKLINKANHNKVLGLQNESNKQQRIIVITVIAGVILITFFLIFIYRKLQTTKKQKQLIENQKEELSSTHNKLEEVSQEISDSIDYAQLIQYAALPTLKIEDLTKESFIYFNPKEKVSGDFYWIEQKEEYHGYAVADCTGHGIPGAFISMVGTILLNEIYNSKNIYVPNEILDELSRLVRLTLTNKEGYTMKDGMDISFAVLDNKTKMLYFSGANNPVWIASKNPEKRINKEKGAPLGEKDGKYIYEIKGDKQPIGDYGDKTKPFTLNSAHLEEGDVFYLFSDGYADQFGGEKNKKFKTKPFRELLLSVFEKNMEEQKFVLNENFQNWKGDFEQIDDVTIMGVRV